MRLFAALCVGASVFAGISILWALDLFELAELKALDHRFVRYANPEKANRDIVVVAIDEASLDHFEDQLGRWPWPRDGARLCGGFPQDGRREAHRLRYPVPGARQVQRRGRRELRRVAEKSGKRYFADVVRQEDVRRARDALFSRRRPLAGAISREHPGARRLAGPSVQRREPAHPGAARFGRGDRVHQSSVRPGRPESQAEAVVPLSKPPLRRVPVDHRHADFRCAERPVHPGGAAGRRRRQDTAEPPGRDDPELARPFRPDLPHLSHRQGSLFVQADPRRKKSPPWTRRSSKTRSSSSPEPPPALTTCG